MAWRGQAGSSAREKVVGSSEPLLSAATAAEIFTARFHPLNSRRKGVIQTFKLRSIDEVNMVGFQRWRFDVNSQPKSTGVGSLQQYWTRPDRNNAISRQGAFVTKYNVFSGNPGKSRPRAQSCFSFCFHSSLLEVIPETAHEGHRVCGARRPYLQLSFSTPLLQVRMVVEIDGVSFRT